MSRPVLHLHAAIVLGIISAAAYGGVPIQWAPDLENARAAAVSQNKLLLLHFWTPDCGPCKVVDQNVFPMPPVAEAVNENYVPLKVNAYQNPDLRDHFKVDRWPTDIIATADGETVFRMVTPQHPDRYVHELMNVIAKYRSAASTSPLASQSAQSGPNPAVNRQPSSSAPWADGIEAAEISENTARAMRPGVESIPGVDPQFRSDVVDFRSDRYSASVNQGQPRFDQTASSVAPRFEAAQDRFTHELQSTPASADGRISNPYLQQRHSNAVAEHRGAGSLAHQRQAESPQSNLVARNTAGRGIAGEQPTNQTPPNHATPPQQLAQNPSGREAPPNSPPVGLDGRCPVTLINKGTWKKGDARWGAVHRGNVYLFAGPEEQQEFLSNPDEFSPVLAGMDVVRLAEAGKVVRGSRQFGVLFDDDGSGPNSSRIYLFDSVDSRNRFESQPDVFLRPVMQAMRRNALDTLLR